MKRIAKKQKKVKYSCAELDKSVEKLLWKRQFNKAREAAALKVRENSSPKNLYTLALALATAGFLQNDANKKKMAKKYYRKIIKQFPYSMHALLAKARLEEEGGKLKEPLSFYKKAFNKCRTDRNAVHIGNVYFQLNKKKLAKKYYNLAEQIKRGSARIHFLKLKKQKGRL